MDGYTLRCNNLRCRSPIETRAVVTTCSHVFCQLCAESLHLTNPPPNHPRRCPACDTFLSAPDDAVITILNPSDDYKTSLLSGLSPSTIMEICSRGLAFWNYQVTQEAVYQEHMAKSLTEKYNVLSGELDKVIHDANSEISRLRDKVAVLAAGEDEMKRKNHELMENWREKGRKLTQVQELYDKLKRRTLISGVRDAAVENVEQALHTPQLGRLGHGGFQAGGGQQFQTGGQPYQGGGGGQVYAGGGMPAYNPGGGGAPVGSIRRQRGVDDDDVFMTGARTGTVNGVPRSVSGSINSDELGSPRQRARALHNTARQRTSSYRMEAPPAFGFTGIPTSSQEHRQRLPPTPMLVGRSSSGVFGQNEMPFAMGGSRNPLGQMQSNSVSNGRARKR